MKNVLFALIALTMSSAAFAGPNGGDIFEDPVLPTYTVVMNASDLLQTAIFSDMRQQTDSPYLSDFSVNFDQLRCLDGVSSEFEPKTIGVCIVPAGASQVSATYVITVIGSSITINSLQLDAE